MAAKLAARIKAQTKVVQVPGLQCENVRAVHAGVHWTRVLRQHRELFLGLCSLPYLSLQKKHELQVVPARADAMIVVVRFHEDERGVPSATRAVMETCRESLNTKEARTEPKEQFGQRMPWHFLLSKTFPAVRLPPGRLKSF